MKKYIYIAITIEKEGKYFSYAMRTYVHINLLSALKVEGIINATYYDTKKRCKEVCDKWNKQYKENGEYLYE